MAQFHDPAGPSSPIALSINTNALTNQDIKPIFAAVGLGVLIIAASAFARGAALTYPGQLQNGTNSANCSYDIAFTLFATKASGITIVGPVTNAAGPVAFYG